MLPLFTEGRHSRYQCGVDRLILYLLKGLTWAVNRLPLGVRLALIERLARLIAWLSPKHLRVARENLLLAFPERTAAEREQILQRSFGSLARLVVDFLRLPELTPQWLEEHISSDFFEQYRALKAANPGKGVLVATGHLGSFELLAQYGAAKGAPSAFIVRNSALPAVDGWWRSMRERNGNKTIDRKGAALRVLRLLQNGSDVAVLFDQNVRKEHAVFVPWFGKLAATTRTVGLSAVRCEASLAVAAVQYRGDEQYRVVGKIVDCADIYRDATLTDDAKIEAVTQRLSTEFEKLIRESPHEWFWMHRRWRTRPE